MGQPLWKAPALGRSGSDRMLCLGPSASGVSHSGGKAVAVLGSHKDVGMGATPWEHHLTRPYRDVWGTLCPVYPELLTQGCPNRPQLSDPLTPVVHLLTGYHCPQLLTIPNSLWAEMTGLPKALCHRRLTAQPRRQEELTHQTPGPSS